MEYINSAKNQLAGCLSKPSSNIMHIEEYNITLQENGFNKNARENIGHWGRDTAYASLRKQAYLRGLYSLVESYINPSKFCAKYQNERKF